MKGKRKGREFYTTGEVAEICGVSITTVNKWIAGGELKAYRMPLSVHKRVLQEEVEKMAGKYGIPLRRLEGDD